MIGALKRVNIITGGSRGANRAKFWPRGAKCGMAPLSETNFMIMYHYVNLVSLYHVGIGRFWPSLCKRLDPPLNIIHTLFELSLF